MTCRLALLLFATLPALAPAQDKCSIEGSVVNGASGAALRKARIMLRKIENGNSRSGLTDAAGHFVFSNLEPGRYALIASHDGFVTQQYGAGGRFGSLIALEADGKRDDVTLRLIPQGVVTGRVVDEDGDPVPNANVQLFRGAYPRGVRQLLPTGNANTNDRGEYRVFGVEPGKYYASATYRAVLNMPSDPSFQEEAYPAVFYPNTLDSASASILTVTPGQEIRAIDFTLSKTRAVRVRGVVTDLSGRPAPRTAIMLIPRDRAPGRSNRLGAGANDKGQFDLHGVLPGAYILAAESNDGQAHLSGRQTLDVGNSNLDGITLSMVPLPRLSGRIAVEGGAAVPLTPLHVVLEPKSAAPLGGGGGQTNADGTFKLDNVNAEPYGVSLYGLNGGLYLKSVKFGDQDVTDSGLDFTQGVTPGELVITVSPAGGQVEGIVQGENQQPVSRARVVLVPATEKRSLARLFHATGVDPQGHYIITGIPPGEYKLFAWEQVDQDAWFDPDFLKPFESRGETVSIQENSRETKPLKIIPAAAGIE